MSLVKGYAYDAILVKENLPTQDISQQIKDLR
jgi:hypothetical protein